MSLNISSIQTPNTSHVTPNNVQKKPIFNFELPKELNIFNFKDLGKIDTKKPSSEVKPNINILEKPAVEEKVIYPTQKSTINKKNESSQDVYYINGILTGKNSAEKSAEKVADLVNKPVNLIYNPSEGFLNDVVEAAVEVMDIHAPQQVVDKTAERFHDTLKSGKELKIVAHSQGAAITAQALTKIEERFFREGCTKEEVKNLMKKVTVVTMGGASSKEDYSPYVKLVERKNENDLVPKLASKTGLKRTEDSLAQIFESKDESQKSKLWDKYIQKSDERTLGKIGVAFCGLTSGSLPILSEYFSLKSQTIADPLTGKASCSSTADMSLVDVINKYHSNYLANSEDCKAIAEAIS